MVAARAGGLTEATGKPKATRKLSLPCCGGLMQGAWHGCRQRVDSALRTSVTEGNSDNTTGALPGR